MKQYRGKILVLIVIVAIFISTLWLVCLKHRKRLSLPVKSTVASIIKTSHPVRRDFSLRLYWFGKVKSKRILKIISLINGKIIAIKVADGVHVRKGDTLFILGGSQIKHIFNSLAQRITALKQQVLLAKKLVQHKRNAVAEKIAKKEELLSAQEHLSQLKSELFAAKEKLSALRNALIVTSPMNGIFTNRQVNIGQNVKQGSHLADVISTDLRIIAYLFPPKKVELIGKKAIIQVDQEEKIDGTVVKVLPELTKDGATVVWIEGPKISKKLKPNQIVSGWIVLKVHKNSLAVPRDAVVYDEQGRPFVFVKTSHGYRKKAIKIGLTNDRWCEVVSGLSDSEEVVIHGAYELFYQNFAKSYKVED